MVTEVIVGGWEHRCGDAIERGDIVTWDCVVHTDGDQHRVHHFQKREVRTVPVHGRVVDLAVVSGTGQHSKITRVPSGIALTGFDPDDDGDVTGIATGQPVTGPVEKFIVTIFPTH